MRFLWTALCSAYFMKLTEMESFHYGSLLFLGGFDIPHI